MREKTKVIESTQGLGNDLAGVLALQRKLAGTERDLEAIASRVGELTREANALAAGHPAQAPAINARLGEVQAGWEDLRATMRRREESLGEARRLQDFLRSLDDFQAWLGRTQTSVASEEGPATLPEAEALLAQHAALRGEVERARSEYSQLRAVGEEVTRDQADPQCLFLRQRLEALGTGWEELGRMWESRQGRLAQAHGFQGFLRDARQAEGVLSSQVRVRGALWTHVRALNPPVKTPPSCPDYLPKAPPPNSNTQPQDSTYGFQGTVAFCLCYQAVTVPPAWGAICEPLGAPGFPEHLHQSPDSKEKE